MKFNLPQYLHVRAMCLAVAGLNSGVQAAPPSINGAISFAGIPALDGPIATATAFTNFTFVTVASGQESGSYTTVPGNTPATWTPFTFDPPATSVIPLWALTNNGVICSFYATSMTVVFRNSSFLNIEGTGIAHITGFADTPGTWTLAANQTLSSFAFSGGADASVTNVPVLRSVAQTNGTLTFAWNALPGQPYQVEYTTNLTSANWNNLGGAITATDTTATVSEAMGPRSNCFYRVLLLP